VLPVAGGPQPTEEINDDTDTEDVEKIPAQQVDQNSIEQESLEFLQNSWNIQKGNDFSRKEKVDVFKVIAQTLLDIRKKLLGEEDAK